MSQVHRSYTSVARGIETATRSRVEDAVLVGRFKVRRTTAFSKVYGAYANQKAIQEDSIVFVFDGTRVQKDSTPDSLGMEDGDIVDCQIHQTGGSG